MRRILLAAILLCGTVLHAQTGRSYQGASPNTNSGNAGVNPPVLSCPSNADTILPTHRASFLRVADASPCAVALPQAGTPGFGFNFVFAQTTGNEFQFKLWNCHPYILYIRAGLLY
jgi:hypothetical protein